MLFTYLLGPLGSHADFTYLLTGSKPEKFENEFFTLKTPEMFSDYPTSDIYYHQPF